MVVVVVVDADDVLAVLESSCGWSLQFPQLDELLMVSVSMMPNEPKALERE